jgi:hypothetical protein
LFASFREESAFIEARYSKRCPSKYVEKSDVGMELGKAGLAAYIDKKAAHIDLGEKLYAVCMEDWPDKHHTKSCLYMAMTANIPLSWLNST